MQKVINRKRSRNVVASEDEQVTYHGCVVRWSFTSMQQRNGSHPFLSWDIIELIFHFTLGWLCHIEGDASAVLKLWQLERVSFENILTAHSLLHVSSKARAVVERMFFAKRINPAHFNVRFLCDHVGCVSTPLFSEGLGALCDYVLADSGECLLELRLC
jgi:hypothetical protein